MCLYVKRRPTDLGYECPSPSVATEPIRCLKVVRKTSALDPRPDIGVTTDYFPPIRDYYGFKYYIGETARMGGVCFKNEPCVENTLQATVSGCLAASLSGYEHEVNHGLHTYRPDSQGARFLYDALKHQIDRRYNNDGEAPFFPSGERSAGRDEAAILECEIPAGALYYEGVSEESDSVDTRGYASDRLTVLRELTPEEVEKLPAPPAHYS